MPLRAAPRRAAPRAAPRITAQAVRRAVRSAAPAQAPAAARAPRRTFRAAPHRKDAAPAPSAPAAQQTSAAPAAVAPGATAPGASAFPSSQSEWSDYDEDEGEEIETDDGEGDEMDGYNYGVVGDVYGEDVDGEVLGDVYGYSTVGRKAPPRRRAALAGPTVRLGPRPAWRNQIAPGVSVPGEGLQPLPLAPNLNNGVFTAAIPTIQYQARPQAPFRAERLLTSVRRSGAAGVLILAQNLFIGRELQLVELGSFDIEFFSPTAFGVRLKLSAAQPGVLITLTCTATPAVSGADTVAASMMFLGASIG